MAVKTLLDILEIVRDVDRDDLLWSRSPGEDEFRSVSARDFLRDVDRFALGLRSLGVAHGDRVGLIASNRPEWHVVDFACHRLGAIVVPLFSTLSGPQIAYCFGDAGCTVAVVDSEAQVDKLRGVRHRLPSLRVVVAIEADAAGDGTGPSYDRLLETGARLSDGGAGDELAGPGGADAIATVIYTSGTTGPPKGVMLTHGNLLANVEAGARRIPTDPSFVCLSLLPLCHVFERMADYHYLASGCTIAYGSPARVSDDFLLVRPHTMIGVPRLYEKIRDSIEDRVAASGALARRAFRIAFTLGMKRARAELAGEPMTVAARALQRIADRLVLRSVRAGFGGRVRHFASGGAALDPRVNWWFEAIGVRLVQGYGLTESSPVISGNSLEGNRVGTVGPPLDNVDVRIAADGEILVRGPSIMPGYWNRPEETEEAIVDGWLHTGDIGYLDEDGYLVVTDRKKEILVTSTGKNVSPQSVEAAIAASPYVDQVLVVGDGRKFLSGLIVPAFPRLAAWASEHGIDGDAESLCGDPRVVELMGAELERLQDGFAPFERVREFRLLSRGFTIESGMMTPTLKLVRRRIIEHYAHYIDDMYAS